MHVYGYMNNFHFCHFSPPKAISFQQRERGNEVRMNDLQGVCVIAVLPSSDFTWRYSYVLRSVAIYISLYMCRGRDAHATPFVLPPCISCLLCIRDTG